MREAPATIPSEVSKDAVFAVSPDVILREVAGERFLVPIRSGLADLQAIFAVNAVGACIWERLDGERSLDEVLAAIVHRFDIPAPEASADLASFVGELLAAGLVERRR